jgi:Asp-tRNA(Asn)/Glu-tRNA(Gln) amidotransferase A subunit family amidase
MADLSALSAQTLTALGGPLASGEITHRDILESQLARIAAREPDVQAWAWHDAAQVSCDFEAQQEALHRVQADASPRPLPLAGLAIGIKDIIDTAELPTQYGSQAYRQYRPGADAQVIQRLKAAGAIVMGKTVTTEFAHVHAGPTVNPHNFLHTPGGSSSGSAAAVADGMVALALGSQTGGSTIRPAAFCGIVGFKPTYARVDLSGVLPLSASMDTMGLMGRSVADVTLLSSVLLGHPAHVASIAHRPRIAWYPGPNADEADTDSAERLVRAREQLRMQGADLVEIELSHGEFAAVGRSNRIIMAYEASRQHQALYRSHPEQLGSSTIKLIELGLSINPEQYENERKQAARCRLMFHTAMQGVDALLTYSAPGQAPLTAAGTGASTFNRIWTTLGAPCLTLPAGRGNMGLPLGLQFVAAHGNDYGLLQLGDRFEAVFKD